MDRPTNKQIIALLERCKQDHYSEPEGLSSCDALMFKGGKCSCGAERLNEDIEAMIVNLRASPSAGKPVAADMSTNFTTRQVAEFVGVETWRVQRLFECGRITSPSRFAGKRAIPSAQVPAIIEALRERGWLPAEQSEVPTC